MLMEPADSVLFSFKALALNWWSHRTITIFFPIHEVTEHKFFSPLKMLAYFSIMYYEMYSIHT